MKNRPTNWPKQVRTFFDNYKAVTLLAAAILLSTFATAQVDTTKPIQQINAHGYSWKNATVDSSFGIPTDTFKLRSTWTNRLAIKNGVIYNWRGSYWAAIARKINDTTLLVNGDTVKVGGSGGGADGNNYPTSLSYNASTRVLTLARNGTSAITVTLPTVNYTEAGLMSAADKARLDSNYFFQNGVQSGSSDSLLVKVNDSTSKIRQVELEQGTNVTITESHTGDKLKYTISSAGGGGGTPAGDSTAIQRNKAGTFDGLANRASLGEWDGLRSRISTSYRQMFGDTLHPAGKSIIFYGNSILNGSQADNRFTAARLISYSFNSTADLRVIDGTGLYGGTPADSAMVNRLAGIPTYNSSTHRYIVFLYGPQGGSMDTTVDNTAYRAAYYRVIDTCTARGWPTSAIVLMSWVHTKLAGAATINPKITALQDSIADEKNVQFVNTYQYMLDNGRDALVAADNIHTNTLGQSVMAEAFHYYLGTTRRTAFQKVQGNSQVDGYQAVGSTLDVGSSGTFGNKLTVTSPSTGVAGLNLYLNAFAGNAYNAVKFKNLTSTDSTEIRVGLDGDGDREFGFYHNAAPKFIWSNQNNNFLINGAASTFTEKLVVNGNARVDQGFLRIQNPTSNTAGLHLHLAQFAGNIYHSLKFTNNTSTDSTEIRSALSSGGDRLFGFYYNGAGKAIYSALNDNFIVGGGATSATQKFFVNGSTRLDGNVAVNTSVSNTPSIHFHLAQFGGNIYHGLKFTNNTSTDSTELRSGLNGSGDRLFGLYHNGNAKAIYSGTNDNFLIGGASAANTEKLVVNGGGRFENVVRITNQSNNTPSIYLHLNTFTANTYQSIKFMNNVSSDSSEVRSGISGSGDRLFGFYWNGAAKAIYSSLNDNFIIGNGSTSATQKLFVNGTSRFDGIITNNGMLSAGSAPVSLVARWTDSTFRQYTLASLFTSPALTGIPTAPTASTGTNTTQVSTTAFVKNSIDAVLQYGSWTPTITNVTNVTATIANGFFTRVGDVVNFSLQITIDPTATGAVEIGLSLPVTSAFTADTDAAGTATSRGSSDKVAVVQADGTNDRLSIVYTCTDITAQVFHITGQYRVYTP